MALVKVILSGDYEIKSINVSDEAKNESQNIINDLIIAAYNNAKAISKEIIRRNIQSYRRYWFTF